MFKSKTKDERNPLIDLGLKSKVINAEASVL